MYRSAVPAAALLLGLIACQPEQTERTREVVEQGLEKGKQGYEQGVESAKQGYEQGVESAKQGYDQGVESAKQGYDQGVESAKQGVESAKEGIADARERYAVDERYAEAQKKFSSSMDEAADSFAELAAASRDGAANISAAIDERGKAGIEGAAEAISCKPDPDGASRCEIGKELLDKLQNEPKLLAREIMLLPKSGSTGEGLQLVRLGDKSIPELLGFSRKDILLELNGVKLSSLDAIRQLDEAMAGKPEAEIVFERDGERQTIVLEPE